MEQISNSVRWALDGVSAVAVLGAIIGALPAMAALGAMVWYAVQIYESATFQHWYANHRMKRRARRLARLRSSEKLLAAEIAALDIVKIARAEARNGITKAIAEGASVEVEAEIDLQSKLPDFKSKPSG